MRELEQLSKPVNSLEGEGFSNAFAESSLFRTVLARQSARWAADDHSSATLVHSLKNAPPAPHEIFHEQEFMNLDNSMMILSERGIDVIGDSDINLGSMDTY